MIPGSCEGRDQRVFRSLLGRYYIPGTNHGTALCQNIMKNCILAFDQQRFYILELSGILQRRR